MPSLRTLCGSLSLHPSPLGAAMHEAGYAALGLPFVYVPFTVTDLAGAVAGMRALGVRGLGVSYPYKQEIMKHLDAIDPLAARIGAVNTIVNDAGKLLGCNTDAEGAARAIEEARPLAGAQVLVLGAGGAARAIAHAAADRGADVQIANRSMSGARALAAAVKGHAVALEGVRDTAGFDVLVNATPRGMSDVDPSSPLPAAALRPGLVVLDAVYKPIETALLADARRCGAIAIHGGRMLLHQAAAQFGLYTGKVAPLEAMDAALRAALA